jgi:hypothetical protein
MNSSSKAPKVSLKSQRKGTKFFDQLQRVYSEFFNRPQTMKMLSVRTGIDRANVCWYCRKFRKLDKIWVFKIGICPITKHLAIYWTTNPDLVPSDPQTKLF